MLDLGTVASVRGSVVDVRFPNTLPELLDIMSGFETLLSEGDRGK